MQDLPEIKNKYFIDPEKYNCPYCDTNKIPYEIFDHVKFDWSNSKTCHAYFVECTGCEKISLHLSYVEMRVSGDVMKSLWRFRKSDDIDSLIFYSQPTSYFALDERVPSIIRELVTEAEGCLKSNYLTGSSACLRKSIYELSSIEDVGGDDYQSRIKNLGKKYTNVSEDYFDILSTIQTMTSDKVHEDSWEMMDSKTIKLFLETLKTILEEIYVIPQVIKDRHTTIQKLREVFTIDKNKTKSGATEDNDQTTTPDESKNTTE